MIGKTKVQSRSEQPLDGAERELYLDLIEQFHEVAVERYGHHSDQARTSAWLLKVDD